jgi:hypothetical protein
VNSRPRDAPPTAHALTKFEKRCDGMLRFGRLANLVGYIRIDSFFHPGGSVDPTRPSDARESERARRFVDELDASIRELDFVESLVLDLRFNHGGFAATVVEIASRFAKPGQELLTTWQRDASDDPSRVVAGPIYRATRATTHATREADRAHQPRHVQRRRDLPLTLVRRDPPAIRSGRRQRGVLPAPGLTLPNGWISPTPASPSAPRGEFRGRGLPPDVEVEVSCADGRTDAALREGAGLVGER